MAAPKMRVRWDYAAIRAKKTDPDVMEQTRLAADGLARELRSRAPVDTGAAAASIDARDAKRAQGAVDVGWDAEHFYLIFPEYGTEFQEYQRFARDSLDSYIF